MNCRRLSCLALLCSLPAFGADAPSQRGEFGGATPLQWSVRMAASETNRLGDRLVWREGGNAKWDYTAGLFTLSLLELDKHVPDPQQVAFVESAIGSFVTPDGRIQGYKADDFSLDNINPGRTLLALLNRTGKAPYRKAVDLLRQQLKDQPRTSDGGFWHKKRYPDQMWLDGIYMAEPFYVQYARKFNQPDAYADVSKQIETIRLHTFDQRTGLFYHGWDERRRQEWANPATGTSSNFWGRAMGWYGMALVDVLDSFPDRPERAQIIATLRQLAAGIVKYQDPASGLWFQVVDQGNRQGNYLEATASSMFVYTLAKGINRGYLGREYRQAATDGYRGIIDRLISVDARGGVSLIQCCSVAGLGFGRDGSFAYYIREPVVENDLKGVGPFILAGIEVQDLLGLPAKGTAKPGLSKDTTEARAERPLTGEWLEASNILSRIHEPGFPAREFPITAFGAVADGQADCTESIRRAIEACHQAGGGHVVVAAGNYLTGPIRLRSGVDLHLDEGATLSFKTNTAAYLPVVLTRFEGMECYNYSPLIYAFGEENIAVTGKGMLDGQADDQTWWPWKGKKEGTPNQKAARERLAKMVASDAPVDQRRFGEGDFLRPNFIQTYRCRKVLIEGLRIRRSPMWEINPVLSTNVIVRDLDIVSHGPNNDGCDPDACRDVLIENCLFDTGDDCIAIKSGRNNDGRRIGAASENLVIRHCRMKDGHAGVAIGSEISGGCSNVFVEDCTMDSPNLDRVLRLKSNAVRGGTIQNVFMRDVTVGRVASAVLQIDFMYEEGANGPYKPAARNIRMQNISVSQTPRVFDVAGFAGSEISGVRISNSTFRNLKDTDVLWDGADVKTENCTIERAE